MENFYNKSPEELKEIIAENQRTQQDGYIKKNRWFVTASMLKTFEKSPEAYFLTYILEVNQEEKESSALKMGTMVDDYISYWEKKFFEKYYLDEGFLKPDLVAMCNEELIDPTGTKEVLEARLFAGKIKISTAEKIKCFWMLDEWKRQPLFDFTGNYETQKVLTTEYKWLKLKATLDRLMVEKKLLRDMKTTNNLKKFGYAVIDYWYDFSMSFYHKLCKEIYWEDFIVILDACQSTAPFPSSSLIMPEQTITNTLNNRVIPNIEILARLTKKWNETTDPKIWLNWNQTREELYELDAYTEMETSLQTQFEYLQ